MIEIWQLGALCKNLEWVWILGSQAPPLRSHTSKCGSLLSH